MTCSCCENDAVSALVLCAEHATGIHEDVEIADVVRERTRQDRRWGSGRDFADGTRATGMNAHALTMARLSYERAEREHGVTWLKILEEEFCEVAAEEDEARLYGELVQVAAVCAAWMEAIRRRGIKTV